MTLGKDWKWDKRLPQPTRGKLKGRGYKVRIAVDPAGVHRITREAVQKADPAWIKSLGPADAKWVFLWAVYENSEELPVPRPSDPWGPNEPGIAAILFDKTTGTVAWKDEMLFPDIPLHGLAGLGGPGKLQGGYIEWAFQSIMGRFPQKIKAK